MKSVIGLGGNKFRIVNSDGFDGVYTRYTVVKGDTLWKIATENGTTVQTLAKVNNIENPDLIEVDQMLYIPEKVEEAPAKKKSVIGLGGNKFRIINSDGFDGVYTRYTVVKGDTLGKIAKEFDTTVETLAKVNEIENVNLIEIDQLLYIPTKEEEKKEETTVKKETVNIKSI